MTERRYTLSEITAAMGIALQNLTVTVSRDNRTMREFIDLTTEQIRLTPIGSGNRVYPSVPDKVFGPDDPDTESDYVSPND